MRVFLRGNRWYYEVIENGKKIKRSLGPGVINEMAAMVKAEERITLTLGEYIEDYLKGIAAHMAKLTILTYRKSLYMFADYVGWKAALDEIGARQIATFAAVRLQKGIKPETVNLDLRHIRAALNKAERWELIEKAPRIDLVKTAKRLPRHLSAEQIEMILEAETEPDFRRLWEFLVWTGCRRGEALGLRWEDVELGDRPQALVNGKGDRQRMVPLLPPAVSALGSPGEGPVFPAWAPLSVSQHFRRLVRRLGITARVHDLRHTCFTWLVAKGVPLKLVQDIAGHASINTTMLYARVYSGDAYETLVKALGFNCAQKDGTV